MTKVSVMAVANYKGHSLSDNGSVNLSFKFKYDQLVNVIQTIQMLSNDINVSARIAGDAPLKLGMFRLKSISIDDDGESVIKLNGLNDYVEVDNLNNLVTKDLFKVKFVAEIEEEDDDGDST